MSGRRVYSGLGGWQKQPPGSGNTSGQPPGSGNTSGQPPGSGDTSGQPPQGGWEFEEFKSPHFYKSFESPGV